MGMETKEGVREVVRTTIDLPADLNRKLLQRCETTKRSRHAEMVFLLEKNFDAQSVGNGKKEKTK